MENVTLKVIEELQRSIENEGVEATIDKLKKPNKHTDSDVKSFIVDSVCEILGVSKKLVFTPIKGQSTIRKHCHLLISYLLYYHAGLNQREIGDLIGKDKSAINRLIKEARRFDGNLKHERNLIAKVDMIEVEIKVFKTKLN